MSCSDPRQVVELSSADVEVGRARGADLRLRDQKVSLHHACLSWRGAGWYLQDLGSTNGTRVRLRERGEVEVTGATALCEGDVLIFGGSQQWRLDVGGRPRARADRIEPPAHAVLEGDDGLIIPGAPDVRLLETDRGWVRADNGEPVEDEEIIEVGGVEWELSLPEEVLETASSAGGALERRVVTLATAAELSLERTAGGDVLAALKRGANITPLRRSSCLPMLWHLAVRKGEWVPTAEVREELKLPTNRLDMAVHRFKEFCVDTIPGCPPGGFIERQTRGQVPMIRLRLSSSVIITDDP